MLRCLTIRCVVARHVDDGDARYSSVCQLFTRCVGTHCAWTDPFNSGSFLSRTALQRSVRSQQAEKYRSTSTHPPLPSWRTEVQSPLLVGRRQHRPRLNRPPQMLAPRALHRQAQLAIHALHLLVVHSHLQVEVQMQPPIAEARMLPRQLPQPFLNLAIVSPASIPAARSWHCHQLADVALAGLVLLQQAPHFRSPLYEPREFFRITDWSMSLSRLRSATSLFNRAFSSRRCLTSSASLTSMPPYLAFQA